jgi:3',5'-cyclic AMP phosphodiesterase CpdA
MIRFALIADAHIGPETQYEGVTRKLSRFSLPHLSEISRELSIKHQPDFVVQLGDLIEDTTDKSADEENYQAGLVTFERMTMPTLNVIGNHDQINLGQADLCKYGKTEHLYYSKDIGDWHCVVLLSTSRQHTDIHIDSTQQSWLADDLASTNKSTLVFLHHPLDDQELAGNIWFEKYPDYCFVEERADVRKIMESSGKVCAVFNGHVHRNNMSVIEGIPYITIQSLVEKVGEPDVCSRAYALAAITSNQLTVQVKGKDPALFKVDLSRRVFASFN